MFVAILALVSARRAFELPPTRGKQQSQVYAHVGSLVSSSGAPPLPYYVDDLFCRPEAITSSPRTFGQSLAGETEFSSPFVFGLGVNDNCHRICIKDYNESQRSRLIQLIDKGYRFTFSLDNVPLAAQSRAPSGKLELTPSVEIGYVKGGKHYVRNNLNFFVRLDGEE